MAKEYKVNQFKKGDFQDNHGNYWCDMALEGISEPVRIVVKDPMQYNDGMTLYGEISNQTSKAGKDYLRFYRKAKDDDDGGSGYSSNTSSSSPASSGGVDWDKKNAEIRAQFCIREAIQILMTTNQVTVDTVEATAKKLFVMVDRVAEARNEKGIESARQVANDLKAKQEKKPAPVDDYGNADPIVTDEEMEEEINLNDIPFN